MQRDSDKVVRVSSPAGSAEQQQSLRAEIPTMASSSAAQLVTVSEESDFYRKKKRSLAKVRILYFLLIGRTGTTNIGLPCHWSFTFLG